MRRQAPSTQDSRSDRLRSKGGVNCGNSFLGALILLGLTTGCEASVVDRPGKNRLPTPPSPTMPGATPVATDPVTGLPVGSPTTPPPGGPPVVPVAPPPLSVAAINCPPGMVDPPVARRVMRLQGSELLASFAGVTAVTQGSVPSGFDTTKLGEKPDPTLSVSRTFYDEAMKVASAMAQSISSDPVGLGCAVAEFGANEACTSAFVAQLAARFFRGVASNEDSAALTTLAREMAARTDGKSALEAVVGAMAMSPKSLYLLEGIDRAVPPTTASPLSAAEMASYISFRIAKRAPSEQLIAALNANYPPTDLQVQSAIDQSFTPAEVQRGAIDFIAAWLKVGAIPGVTGDAKHPEVNPAFLANLQTETYGAVSQALGSGAADFTQLLTGEMSSSLLGDASNPFIATYGRPGVLALPGVLAVISASNHTNVPRRGRALATSLFCEVVPPPPANATAMLPPLAATVSERQKFERVEMEPGCGPCHQRINHLAFAFERYDELGVPRETDEKGNVINTAAMHTLGSGAPLVFADVKELNTLAAQHPISQTCISLEAFQYVTRREAGQGRDDCAVSAIASDAQKTSFRIADLFRESLVRTALLPRAD